MQTIMLNASVTRKPQRATNPIVKHSLTIAESKWSDYFISVCVFINMVCLCIEYYGSPLWYNKMLQTINLVFVIIFMIEAIIKLIGSGISCYFSNAQNSFDFFLVFVSIIGLFEQFLPINITALRVIRGIRILRIFKSMHDLSELLVSLYYSLRSFFYVVMLTFLVMFVFGLLGMHLFNEID